MANGSFKSDESFIQKLAVGAAGTKATIRQLFEMGFRPIELERGSSGFKIWKHIKIKRVRVPDIICLNSGIRFESRGKTKLEISMSHSRSDPNRAWSTGLSASDFVAIVLCEQASSSIVDWQPASPVHFIPVRDMQGTFDSEQVKITKPKGVEEGSEIRVIWPSAIANERSRVIEVTRENIRLQPIHGGGRGQRCQLNRRNPLIPLCTVGDIVTKNQIIASVVPVMLNLTCPNDVGEQYFLQKLSSTILSERYAAAKALRFRGYTNAAAALGACLNQEMEDIYVKLEAAAALATQDDAVGWNFLNDCLTSRYEPVQLETVIVLSEIQKPASQRMLTTVLVDRSRHEEIRAGAAWALGEFRTAEASRVLVSVFDETSFDVKVEAARALLRIAPDQVPLLVRLLKDSSETKRDGLAWVLARQGQFNPTELIENHPDENLRRWTAYILGYGKKYFLEDGIRHLCQSDPEIYFSASVLWQILTSWIHDIKEY